MGTVCLGSTPQRVEGLALQRGRLGADGDRGLVLGGQHNLVQGERGEVPQQRLETVGGLALRGGLGCGFAPGALRDSGRIRTQSDSG